MTAPAVAVVACCQLAPTMAAPPANRELTADAIRQAARQGASIIVLPELVSSGYVFASKAEASANAERPDGPTVSLWARLAADLGVLIVGGFCESAGKELFNSAALVDPAGLQCVYRKAHLWDREQHVFTPGSALPPVVPTKFGLVGLLICYDLEFPEWVRLPALAGAQLICAPVNWPQSPRPAGERPAEVIRVQANAAVNRMFIAACDRVGQERGVDWVGGSVITDPDGWPLAGPATPNEPAIVLAECRLADALDKSVSPLNDVHADRRPELYRPITDLPDW